MAKMRRITSYEDRSSRIIEFHNNNFLIIHIRPYGYEVNMYDEERNEIDWAGSPYLNTKMGVLSRITIGVIKQD
jgi:hypothetical protein